MPTIRRCCIVGCLSNSRQHPQLQFFQFPKPENPFHKLWKQACHSSLSRILPFKKPVVCALHFHPQCIGGRRLTSTAVPSLRLDVPGNVKDVEHQAMVEEIERSRKCAYINAVVYEWLVRANMNPQLRGSITHGMIKEKADSARQLIGSTSFVADNRWLNRFRETHLRGFAQKLATNQLKPLGPSLWIPDIVQELQHLFPPTNQLTNLETVPEQYMDYMQQYGEYEEDEDSSRDRSYSSPYQQQQQRQSQYNMAYDSLGQQAAAAAGYNYEHFFNEHSSQQQPSHSSAFSPPPMPPPSRRTPSVASTSPPQHSPANRASPFQGQSVAKRPRLQGDSKENSPVPAKKQALEVTEIEDLTDEPDEVPSPQNGNVNGRKTNTNGRGNGSSNGNHSDSDSNEHSSDDNNSELNSINSSKNKNNNNDANNTKIKIDDSSPPASIHSIDDEEEDDVGEDEEIISNAAVFKQTNGHARKAQNSSSSLSSPVFTGKILETYEQALEYLKPLEEFVLFRENFRAIGMLSQLELILRKGDIVFGDQKK